MKLIKLFFNRYRLLWITMALQLILVFIGFNKFFVQGEEFAFIELYDGMKNNYTLISYIRQPAEVPYNEYSMMNYPYGDAIFFTDNTPAIAVALRWIHLNVTDITGYELVLFHTFLIFCLWLGTLFWFLILQRFVYQPWLLVLLAIGLTWANPQLLRIQFGCMNLGIPALLLANTWMLLVLGESLYEKRYLLAAIFGISTIGLIIFASFLHLYYLGIMAAYSGVLLFALWLYRAWESRKPQLITLATSLIVPTASGLITWLILRMNDPYHALRKAEGGGFGWDYFNFKFKYLWMPLHHHTLSFLGNVRMDTNWEMHAYLGNFILFSVLAGVLVFLVRGRNWQPFAFGQNRPLIYATVAAGFLCLIIALGNMIDLGFMKFDNWLSPIYVASKFSPEATQFRVIGRFNMVLFIPLGIVASIFASRIINLTEGSMRLRAVVIGIISLLLIMDTKDSIRLFNHHYFENYLSESKSQQQRDELQISEPLDSFDAVLPLPYFHVGSEHMELTVEPDARWIRGSFRVAIAIGKPLIACQMSRSPVGYTHSLVEMIAYNKIDADLYQRIKGKRILVMVDHKRLANPQLKSLQPVDDAWLNAEEFIINQELIKIGKAKGITYYLWIP